PASPGAASGQAVFTSEQAVELTNAGKKVLLVRKETAPDDIHGMFVSQGILTATGGMTSHAAVVGRQMGKPSIVGAGDLDIDERSKQFRVNGHTVKEGDFISFDGLSGEVKLARVASKPSEILQVLSGQMKPQETRKLLARVEQLHEFNPMLGHRGVRLGITYPEITEMQTRAIIEAACQLSKEGLKVVPEIMIPLVGHVNELRDQKAVVDRIAAEVLKAKGVKVNYLVGTMIEVPRGALTANQVAQEAQIF